MSYMSFVAGGDLSGGIKYAVGEMSDTRRQTRPAQYPSLPAFGTWSSELTAKQTNPTMLQWTWVPGCIVQHLSTTLVVQVEHRSVVCLCVCVWTQTFERNDLLSRYLANWFIPTLSESKFETNSHCLIFNPQYTTCRLCGIIIGSGRFISCTLGRIYCRQDHLRVYTYYYYYYHCYYCCCYYTRLTTPFPGQPG